MRVWCPRAARASARAARARPGSAGRRAPAREPAPGCTPCGTHAATTETSTKGDLLTALPQDAGDH